MAESPIEHRHHSRFIGPLAREATYNWRAILLLSFVLFAGGIAMTAAPVFSPYGGEAVFLFFTVLFGMALLLTIMLKSFRKTLVVLYPALLSVVLVRLMAFVVGLTLAPLERIYATIILSASAGVNFMLTKKYFDERRKPSTPMMSVFDTFSKTSKAVAGMYFLEAFTFMGIAAFTPSSTGSLGILVSLGMVYSLVASVIILPAAIMLYERLMNSKALNEHESRVLQYMKSFGSDSRNHPIVAGWLGVAVSDVEGAVDSLRNKGFLGSHFFTLDDPLVWFLLAGSYLLGSTFGLTAFPSLASVWYDLGMAFLLTVALCLLSPQNVQALPKGMRRFLGILLLAVTLVISLRASVILTEILLSLLILGLVSLFFAPTAAWLVGNAAISIYFALVFLLGWLQFDTFSAAPRIWAIGIGAVIFLLQLVIEEEAYVTI